MINFSVASKGARHVAQIIDRLIFRQFFHFSWRCALLWHTSFFIFALDNSYIKLNSSNYGTLENFSKEQRNH